MPRLLPEKIQDALRLALPFSGICFRNVSPEFADRLNILSAQGSLRAGGRFNLKDKFAAIYLSCDLHTCIEETTKTAGRSDVEIAKLLPRTIVGIEVKLSRVLDLTDNVIRRKLGITKKSLIATEWKNYQNIVLQEAFTQQLGRLAREAGFEAILVPSAVTRGKNLDVFPDRLLSGSSLKIINRSRLPLPKR